MLINHVGAYDGQRPILGDQPLLLLLGWRAPAGGTRGAIAPTLSAR